MSNKIILKKSSVPAKKPQPNDLDFGELAINYADGKLYYKNTSNLIESFSDDDSTGSGTEQNFNVIARGLEVTTLLTPLLQNYINYDSITFRNPVGKIGTRSSFITVLG